MTRFLSPRNAIKAAGAGFAGVVTALALATPALACTATVAATPVCLPSGDTQVTWTISGDGNNDYLITVDSDVAVTLSDKSTAPPLNPPIAQGTVVPDKGLTTVQVFPYTPDKTLTATMKVTLKYVHNDRVIAEPEAEQTVQVGGRCDQPPPATASARSDCDNLAITVTNPEKGVKVDARLTPSTGEAKTVTVEPGKSASVMFPGTNGLKVTVQIGKDSQEFEYVKPDNCASPTASPSASASTPAGGAGGGGSLPVTGTSVGLAGGIAAALLAIGGVLFYLFRRRRIHFVS